MPRRPHPNPTRLHHVKLHEALPANPSRMDLETLGWDESRATAFAPHAAAGHVPARITADFGRGYGATGPDGEVLAEVVGKLRHRTATRAELPVIGDWVALQPRPGEPRALIHAVLPRRTKLSRQAAGHRRAEEQLLAANLDTVFVVAGLDGELNRRWIERFLFAIRAGNIEPVVLLNKADLVDDPEPVRREIEALAAGAPVLAVSAAQPRGLAPLRPWLRPRRTVALLGSSGVGKSTIVNRLLNDEVQATQTVRESDAKGRHTTTHRELFLARGGVLVIDTPGMRELQLWEPDAPLDQLFPEITALAAGCRFRDCAHTAEPGCAVKAAVAAGTLDAKRFESFCKLRDERTAIARRARAY
jgi:ribosome biogenesis GTPase